MKRRPEKESTSHVAAVLAKALGDAWFKPKPPSKNELKRREKGLAGRWMPFKSRRGDSFEAMSITRRAANREANSGRPQYRKLTTNIKKLRRQVREELKAAAELRITEVAA